MPACCDGAQPPRWAQCSFCFSISCPSEANLADITETEMSRLALSANLESAECQKQHPEHRSDLVLTASADMQMEESCRGSPQGQNCTDASRFCWHTLSCTLHCCPLQGEHLHVQLGIICVGAVPDRSSAPCRSPARGIVQA